MNSAFRDVIFVNDMTLLRAWLLALVIAIIGANLIEDIGLMGDDGLRRQAFAPIAAIIGGYVFGLGIVMAGGCGSGVLYKQGEGQFAATIATFGFGVGLISTMHGPLKPISQFLKSYKVSFGEGENAITSPALWDVFGGPSVKWIVIAVIAAIIIPVVLKGKPFAKGPKKGWSWSVGGALIGVVVILAWWASYYWGGQARGLSFSGPLSDFLMFILVGNSNAPFDPMFRILGIGVATWSALYVVGVPLGAYISSKGLGEFKLTAPRDPNELVRVFLGGLVMGFGGAVAGG
ncbi:transporter [Dissulfurispira thermophila]|uniref:Transporter n=2 Tax=root TaxID=1 RepID=A0A7G1H218_9BACT|nr:YeeE/YedE family protein [Dissulfurispira thermophila]BCB96844.1 transporter [Dissulfurispira thermophila]